MPITLSQLRGRANVTAADGFFGGQPLFGNSPAMPQRPPQPPGKTWMILGAVSLLAIAGGLILPRSFPAERPAAVAKSTPAAEAKVIPPVAAAATPTPAASAKKDDLAYNPPPWPEAPDPKALLERLG